MNCEMCGASSGLFLVKVEGTTLKLCSKCSSYGSVIKNLTPPPVTKNNHLSLTTKKMKLDEIEENVVADYSNIIKVKREKMGIKQDELAKKINEKESVIHKIETGHLVPDLKLAKKFESFLNVKLVEEVKLAGQVISTPSSSSDKLTLGDIIKIRKR